jgi:N6-adenosine-specific RNA methylase IME4
LKVDIFNTDKKYQIIYADPPWKYADKRCQGACEAHYETMKLEEIKALPVKELADKDCILFLWTTYPMLKEALELIEAWGFTYKSIGFQWIKKNKSGNGWFFGLGRWTRGNTEPCLIATKGKPKRVGNKVSQLIMEPLTRHSAKPSIVRDKIIELMGVNIKNRIELFARDAVEGWDRWGLEAPENE